MPKVLEMRDKDKHSQMYLFVEMVLKSVRKLGD